MRSASGLAIGRPGLNLRRCMPRSRPAALPLSLGFVVLLVLLLPWWRNHSYLRDLYDYGLVIAANGRLDRGELPYVDFTTPIQAGFLGLNWMIDRLGGGSYFGLTLGGAGLIAVSAGLLSLMLARRWPWWAALAVGAAITAAAPAQHTILWHNALGVFCLALVSWAAACAPTLRRAHWKWHGLLFAGLLLGGINKMNFHLVGLAAAIAWALRAGLRREAGWGRVGATLGAVLLAGLVLPVAAELAWTGASFRLWLANVVELAGGSRLGEMHRVLSVDFLLRPPHDYYGRVPLPQAGLVGCLLSLAALVGCWPRSATGARCWDRWLVPVAVLAASVAAAALLATNFEIASIGLAAWLALAVSLWLGFAPDSRRTVWLAGLVLPALVVAATSWWSAWQGQRSQFGYSTEPREKYRLVAGADPVFARLRGLWVPPEIVASLEPMSLSLPDPGPDGRRPVFYGSGLEWLDRYLPAVHRRGEPLWFHWGTTYGPAEIDRLNRELRRDDGYEAVVATVARQLWPDEIKEVLNEHFSVDFIGPWVRRWTRRVPGAPNLADATDASSKLGGNVDGRLYLFDRSPLGFRATVDGRMLLGTTRAVGEVLLRAPVNQLRGTAVLDRLPGSGEGELAADFKVIVHGASPEDERWAARVTLPAHQQSVSVPFLAGAPGKPVMLWVTRPAGQSGGLLAGYRDLELTQVGEFSGAPELRQDAPAEVAATPALADALFHAVAWRPQELVVRGGRVQGGDLVVASRGEVWMHTPGMLGDLNGRLSAAAEKGKPAWMRVLWYKGGRVQILQQGWIPPGHAVDFRAWNAETGGWIGIEVGGDPGQPDVVVRVTAARLQP